MNLCIKALPPERYKELFKTSLEPPLLISIVDVLQEMVSSNMSNPHLKQTVKQSLTAFGSVPRFGTLLMFLSKEEKGKVIELWKSVGVEHVEGPWKSVV